METLDTSNIIYCFYYLNGNIAVIQLRLCEKRISRWLLLLISTSLKNFDLGITSVYLSKILWTILFSLQFCRSPPPPPPGLGFGLIYLPAIVSVTCYFEKKRSFATGIAVCGSGLGTFVFSPLVELLVSAAMRCGRSLLLDCLNKFNRSSFRLACKSCYCTVLANSIDLPF